MSHDQTHDSAKNTTRTTPSWVPWSTTPPTADELRARLGELERRLAKVPDRLRTRGIMLSGAVREELPARVAEWAAGQLKRVEPELAGVSALQPVARVVKDGADRLQEAGAAWSRPPIDGYDEMNVHQKRAALAGLDAWGLEKVRRYEQAHKARKTVLAEVTLKAA